MIKQKHQEGEVEEHTRTKTFACIICDYLWRIKWEFILKCSNKISKKGSVLDKIATVGDEKRAFIVDFDKNSVELVERAFIAKC